MRRRVPPSQLLLLLAATPLPGPPPPPAMLLPMLLARLAADSEGCIPLLLPLPPVLPLAVSSSLSFEAEGASVAAV